jgi:Fe2+ or Zn2+ uptake regulation protein
VIEINECSIDEMIDALEVRHNIEITGHLLELYGKCKDCE